MAKLKMLKMPKVPKLPKKPKASASVTVKENWLRRVKEIKAAYIRKVADIKKENAHRQSEKKRGEALTGTIARIGSIAGVSSVGATHRRKKSTGGTKKRKASIGGVKGKKRSTGKSFKTHTYNRKTGKWRKK